MSKIVAMTGYPMGGLMDVHKEQIKHHHEMNDWYLEHEGKVYNCHPAQGAIWGIRFEIKSYDLAVYPVVYELFPHIFKE